MLAIYGAETNMPILFVGVCYGALKWTHGSKRLSENSKTEIGYVMWGGAGEPECRDSEADDV